MVKKKPPKKRAPVPEGKFEIAGILKLAKSRGIKLTRNQIGQKLRVIRAGTKPWPAGLEQVPAGERQIYHFPEQFVNELFAEARHSKNLPKQLETGRVLPLEKLASGLGLKKDALYKYKEQGNLKTFMVKALLYVTRREAIRFKKWYQKEIAGTMSSKGGKLRLASPEERLKQRKRDYKTTLSARFHQKNTVPRILNIEKKKAMRNFILDNLHLPVRQFDKKIEEMLVEINRPKKKKAKASNLQA